MSRPSADEYFLRLARAVAERSTCTRKSVGCVLVRNRIVLSTGYCGSIRGQPHCIDVGCDIDPATGGCIRTVHSEINAIAQAARYGANTDGTTAYITLSPCSNCFKALANAGIIRIVYLEEYRIPPDKKLAESCGISLEHHPLS